MKESWLDVQLCQEGTKGCHASNDTSSPGTIRFPKHSNEEKVFLDSYRSLVRSITKLKTLLITKHAYRMHIFCSEHNVMMLSVLLGSSLFEKVSLH